MLQLKRRWSVDNVSLLTSALTIMLLGRGALAQPAAEPAPPAAAAPAPVPPAPPADAAPPAEAAPPAATPAEPPPAVEPPPPAATQPPPAPAPELEPPVAPLQEEIEELDLGELLNMKTTVSTKEAASISRSQGMVTAYNEHDIRRTGYYTLSDLADITAGYSSYTIFGEKVFETRGQKAGSFNNNKHLILIDGIPVNHGKGNKAMIDENFPLFFADRVEFLKGPASALYGTSAFFGVVNIAPKELSAPGFRAEGRAGMGTQQVDKRAYANMIYRDRERHAAIYAGFYEKGPSQAYTGSVDNVANRFWDDQRSEFLYVKYGQDDGTLQGMQAGVIYASKNGGLGEFWLGGYSPEYNDLTWVQIVPYLKYERKIIENLHVDAYFKADRDIEKATAAALGSPGYDGTGTPILLYENRISVYEGQAELRWSPIKELNAIGGLNVNVSYQNTGKSDYGGVISADPGPVFIQSTATLRSRNVFRTTSPFLQLTSTLPVLTGLHVTAGARLDAGNAHLDGGDATFSQFSPRAGIVQELTDYLSVKVLYGTALRAPGNKEIGLNNESRPFLADPDLATQVGPEKIRSLEGGLAFNTRHVSANVAGFVNETTDALDGTAAPANDGGSDRNIFQNTPGKIVARGTEVEVAAALDADSRIFVNHAFAKAKLYVDDNDDTGSELADVPIHKVNAGISYRLRAPVDVTGSLIGKWVSGYRTGPQPDAPAPQKPEIDGHFLLDANIIYRVTQHLGLELMARNLTDKTWKLPQGGVVFVPMPRRSFHLTATYGW
jgi:outer membrane receptor protein involved in Fe transport